MSLLCHIDDIEEGAAKSFALTDRSVFAVKQQGEIFVYVNRCPHLGTPLEWQADQFLDPDGTMIQCATHGALFLIDCGTCVTGPCMGQKLEPVDFTIEEGNIHI